METEPDRPDGQTMPKNVIVVEDDPLHRRILSRRLSSLGVESVHEAANGFEALAILNVQPDTEVVISDLAMPEMDGLELLCELGARQSKAAFVLHSAMDRQLLACMELMARERKLNFLGILEKPAANHDLERLLVKAIAPKVSRPSSHAPPIEASERRAGLLAGEFVPYFQPKVSLSDRSICGAEALARWNHPVHGLVPPARFIDAFEDEGLIDQLTYIVLESAVRNQKEWAELGQPISVSVNLSLSFLSIPGVAEAIARITDKHRVSPERVVFEITEGVAMSDVGTCFENIARLKLKGHALAIDDFGVGYSSLQQLIRIPFDEIKLDRSFVTGVTSHSRAALMLEATLGMAQKLRMVSVAEGIETEEEWAFMRALGCDLAQGYLISKPLSESDFKDFLGASKPHK